MHKEQRTDKTDTFGFYIDYWMVSFPQPFQVFMVGWLRTWEI